MMYDVLYHFDGCSYTHGHKALDGEHCIADSATWKHIVNPVVIKDGNYNLNIPLPERAGRYVFKYPLVDYSSIAKSNDMMFHDFMRSLSKFDSYKFGKVFIQWSHSERTGYYGTKKLRQCYNKNVQHFEVVEGELKTYDPYDGPFWSKWMNGIVNTMYYMHAIQEICKAKNLEWSFLTVENYNLFKYAAENYNALDVFNSINNDHIFNWPTKPLVNYPDFKDMDREKVLVVWGTTGLPLQWAKAMEGDNLIDDDKKHLNEDGHRRFGTQILDWTLNREKDISYWLDEPEVYNKSFFYDLKPWKEEYVGIGVHWLEQRVQDALINYEIKPNADYIYES